MNYRSWGALALLAAAGATSAFGQLLSVGIKGGVPLNDGFVETGTSEPNFPLPSTTTNRYIIGPEAELRLPFHLGVEADALYRHYNVNGSGISQWEFPILLKYRFKGIPLVRPFVDAGPTFNHVSDINFLTLNSSTAGIAIGAGLDFHALLFHITPEFRYTHWGSRNIQAASGNVYSNQNETEFLVGLTF
ncbi:MAG: PorT family protein [Nitrospirota bacterium]|nr:PorT family protein [Nitrospirota bacterium]